MVKKTVKKTVTIEDLNPQIDHPIDFLEIKKQLSRHEEWIKLIAKKNNILLPM